MAVGEVAGRKQIAVGFGEADAREVSEGGFDGDVGEVVDDSATRESDARDVDEGDFAVAAEAAEECGFAGAGGAGDEDDLAGGGMGDFELRQNRRALLFWAFEAEPFGDQRAVRGRSPRRY
ncbi:MAG TPA: hypothetical protein VGP94_02185 [Tepidisphaeraceae bacterium]|nr:hypothetical protein [Tepidisphaeraceae bacterium]